VSLGCTSLWVFYAVAIVGMLVVVISVITLSVDILCLWWTSDVIIVSCCVSSLDEPVILKLFGLSWGVVVVASARVAISWALWSIARAEAEVSVSTRVIVLFVILVGVLCAPIVDGGEQAGVPLVS